MAIKIIGGAMRCGKTTLVKRIYTELNISHISTDLVRKAARQQANRITESSLFAWEEVDVLKGDVWAKKHIQEADYLAALFTDESRLLEPYILDRLRSEKGNYTLEGSHILPDFALTITDIAHITYIIDTSSDQYKRIVMQHKTPDKDVKYIQAWSYFNRAYGEYIKSQCKIYGIRCYDIADYGFEKTMSMITSTLTAK